MGVVSEAPDSKGWFDVKMSVRTRFGAVVVAVVSMGIVACGGDDGGSTGSQEEAYSKALAVTLARQADWPFGEEENVCIAGRVLDLLGVQMFIDAGLSAEDVATVEEFDFPELTEEQEADFVEIFLDGDCIDLGAFIADDMIESSGGALSEDQAACIGDGVAESDVYKDVLVASILGREDADSDNAVESEILRLVTDCDIPLDLLG